MITTRFYTVSYRKWPVQHGRLSWYVTTVVIADVLIWTRVTDRITHYQFVLTGKARSTDDVRHDVVHQEVLVRLSQLNNSEIQSRLKSYFKFMFVRHPLERLLSAYRSKFQDLSDRTIFFRKSYGRHIARFRQIWQPDEPVNDVTFPEFVRLVLDAQPNDRHWAPMANLCLPCQIQYDFVGRFEKLEEDANQLLAQIGAIVSFPRSLFQDPRT